MTLTEDTNGRREPNPPPSDLLGLWRLLMGVARSRQRLGLEAQRRRLVRSIVVNDMRRKGISPEGDN